MSGTNAEILGIGMARYLLDIIDVVEKRCRAFCSQLCLEAIRARETAEGAHNYTGNLLNSIVTCLYRDKKPQIAFYAAQYTPEAIDVKMTRPRVYYFKQDYDGRESSYLPDIETDEGWGVDDARNFFQSYRPGGKNLFDIVVAYPVEYADWIERRRGTTGIFKAYDWAASVGTQWLKLPRAAL